ncbi:MAG: sugar phosphate isomerase/epimerase family protein [Chloroflexota bacterium]
MRIGIVQGALDAPDADIFALAAELGFEGLELLFTEKPESDPLWSTAGRIAVLARAHASNVAIPSLMLSALNRGGLANDDAQLQEQARRLVRGVIEAAPELRSRVILVPFFFRAHISDAAAMARTVAGLRELCPEAEHAGLVLAYEGQLPATEIIRLLNAVGSPALRCYYDVGNAVWLGFDPVAELRQLGRERIAKVHFKEIKGEGSGALNDVHLGEGRVPWSTIIPALRDLGYDDWIVLETRTQPDHRSAAAANLATTRRLLPADRRQQRQEALLCTTILASLGGAWPMLS